MKLGISLLFQFCFFYNSFLLLYNHNVDDFFSRAGIKLDELTRVYSKNDIFDYAQFLVAENVPFSFLVVDIDNFKYINDTYGFENGDKILYKVAHLLFVKSSGKGVVGHIDGDHFALVMKGKFSYDETWTFCHELLSNINELSLSEMNIKGISLTATVGLARFPENAPSFEKLNEACQKALYRGKTKGRNCFVIYVPEKHANIAIKSSKEKAMSSSNLIASVFKYLSDGIQNLLDFLSSYFEIDHICIQANERIVFEKIHQMSRTKNFVPVPSGIIRNEINRGSKMYCVNDVKSLLQIRRVDLFDVLAKQNITSTCVFEISYNDELYGLLRADMTGSGNDIRIWQYSDLDVMLTAARALGFVIHFTGTELSGL